MLVFALRLWCALLVIRPTTQAIVALTFAQYAAKPFFTKCAPPEDAVRLLAAACLCEQLFNIFQLYPCIAIQNIMPGVECEKNFTQYWPVQREMGVFFPRRSPNGSELLERALGDACAECLHVGQTGRPGRHHHRRSLPPFNRFVFIFLGRRIELHAHQTHSIACKKISFFLTHAPTEFSAIEGARNT